MIKTAKEILIERRVLVPYKGRLDFNLSRDGHIQSMNDILLAMHEYAQQFSEAHIKPPDELDRDTIKYMQIE